MTDKEQPEPPISKEKLWRQRWIAKKRAEMGEEAFTQYWRALERKRKPETLREQRRRYNERVAKRTAATARATGQSWNIEDARTALDTSLTVPQAALKTGRTAKSVESLRHRWRAGKLPAWLQDHLPMYKAEPAPSAGPAKTARKAAATKKAADAPKVVAPKPRKKPTKAEFERRLNEVHGVSYDRKGTAGQYGARIRPYGTYLRRQDPGMFDWDYQAWLEQGDAQFFGADNRKSEGGNSDDE